MNKNGVSVIIPTYNRANIIMRSIESVISQSYVYIEIIIVDDNSTDNTEEVIKNIEDERIIYKKLNKRMGPANARNIGVKLAKYDLIAFQDSDDVWKRDKLKVQIAYMEKNKIFDMVYCPFMHKGIKSFKIPADIYSKNDLEGEIYKGLLKENKIGTPTMLIRKEKFEKVGGFNVDLKAYEDWEFAIRFAQKYQIGYVDKILVEAYSSSDGVNSNERNKARALFYILEKYDEREAPNYIKRILIYISSIKDTKEFLEWKRNLVPKYISSDEDFDIIMSILHMKTEEKENFELMLKLSDKSLISNRSRNLNIKKNETIVIYGVTEIGNELYRTLKKIGYKNLLYTDSNLVTLQNHIITPLTELPQNIDWVITSFSRSIDNSFINEKLNTNRIISVYSIFT